MDYTTLTAIIILITPFHIWLFWVTSIIARAENRAKFSLGGIIMSELTAKAENIRDEIREKGISHWIPGILQSLGFDPPAEIQNPSVDMPMTHGRIGSKVRPIKPTASCM